MKHIYILLLVGSAMFATGCDRAFQFASTVPETPKPVCTASPEDLSVPVLVQQGQSFSMSYNYENVAWVLTNGSSILSFNGSPVETSLNTLGTYIGSANAVNGCGDTVSQEFAIQVIAPVAGLSIVINNSDIYTRVSNANLTLSARGATEMYISNVSNCTSGGTWESYSTSKAWTLGESNKLTRVYVKYKNALLETPCISDDITHDDVVPVTRFVSVPSGITNATTAVVDMDSSDNVSGVKAMYCKIDAEAYRVCQTRETFSSLAQGLHTVSMYAEDNAGNVSSVDARSFTVDTTLPTVRITQAPTDPSSSRNAEFRFDGEDNGQPISNFDCSLDNAAFATCTTPKNYTNLAQGAHIFKVRGRDAAGNLSGEASHSWTIDSLAPTVIITSAPSSPTPETNANFAFTVTDSGMGIASLQCALDSGAAVDCTSPHSYTNLPNAIHTFTVTARDFAGNTASASHIWEVNDRIQTQPIIIQEGIGSSDILFLMDSTASMYREYNTFVPNQFRNFLSGISGTNYRIGVVTGDYRDSSGYGSAYRDGKIVPLEEKSPLEYILTPQSTNQNTSFIETLARREVTCTYGTWTGPNNSFCGTSGWNLPNSTQMIPTGIKAIEHAQNQFFFRPEAALDVVIVSDSNEVCSLPGGIDGLCPVADVAHRPEALINAIRAKFPEKTVKIHSVVHKAGDTGCDMGPSAVGHTYVKLSELTGGVARSVCKSTPSEGNAIANAIKASSQPTYPLRCVPRDLNNDGRPDVTVTYNPQPAQPIVHEVIGSTIKFTPSPAAGTNVTLTYTCP